MTCFARLETDLCEAFEFLWSTGHGTVFTGNVHLPYFRAGTVTLDGVDNNDQRQGYAFTGVLRSTPDSVEEFRVTTTNSNADNGRSSGAQVTLVTKSGTNSFHGSLYEYNRNNIGHANDWFNKAAEISTGLPLL